MGFRKNDIDGIHSVYLKEKLEHRSLSQSISIEKRIQHLIIFSVNNSEKEREQWSEIIESKATTCT